MTTHFAEFARSLGHSVAHRLRRPASVWAQIGRLLIVRSVGLVVLVAMVLVGQAQVITQSGVELEPLPGVQPLWSTIDRTDFPGCVDAADWPPHTWGGAVVAYVPADGRVELIEFGQAWARTHNASTADDLDVLGVCR